jgi:hypothetical protein
MDDIPDDFKRDRVYLNNKFQDATKGITILLFSNEEDPATLRAVNLRPQVAVAQGAG